MPPQQKRGILVGIPKKTTVLTPADVRPITLLNADYKMVTRMVTRRLKPLVQAHLANTQFCGVEGNTIMEAVATIRDVIAYAEQRNKPLCVLALDFEQAFDRMSQRIYF
jgi:hypothetical protein